VPFFFVIIGSHVDWRVFLDPNILTLALAVTAVAIVGKLVGGVLPLLGLGRRSAAIVGVGMVPRGEVGLIVASIGLRMGIFPEEIFSVVVIMSILTTLFAPPLLRRLYRGAAAGSPQVQQEASG
jgi:Kef-type K+ transport system membrane component KefB